MPSKEIIIKSLRCCASGDSKCGKHCPYYKNLSILDGHDNMGCDVDQILNDAADALEASCYAVVNHGTITINVRRDA